MDRDLLDILRALADPTRLRLVGLLAGHPSTVEELAAAVGLSAATVVHHLKRLRDAGLVTSRPSRPYVVYALVNERLHAVAAGLDRLERSGEAPDLAPGPDGRDLPAYDAKVLRGFVADGRLRSIPAQEKKRLVVLRWLLERCFPDDRPYPEWEVNERIGAVHPDTAALRRYLVEHRLMARSAGVYRRT